MAAALGKYTLYQRGAVGDELDEDADRVYLRLQRFVNAELRGSRNPTAQCADLLLTQRHGGMLHVPVMGMQDFDVGRVVSGLRAIFGPEADMRLDTTGTAGINATILVPTRLPGAGRPPTPWWRRGLWGLFLLDPKTTLLTLVVAVWLAWLGATRGIEQVTLLRVTRDVLWAVVQWVERVLGGVRR